jgi:hypothetical protein
MDISHPSTLLVPAGIAALIGWRLYARVRRMVARQRLSSVRPWLTVCLFPLLLALVLIGSLANPVATLALAAGTLAGAGLGVYGIRLTRFEQTPQGLFYTPNAHLGIALSVVFIGRLVYRAAHMYATTGALHGGGMAFGRSPLTLLIFGALAAYYVAYAAGLLRWSRRVRDNPSPA